MPSLQILKGPNEGAVLSLLGEQVVLGRNPDCDLVIPIISVSRRHGRIFRDGDQYFIEDNRSRNGTFVNNQAVTVRTPLKNNDRIRICDFIAAFLDDTPPTTTTEYLEPDENGEDLTFALMLEPIEPAMTESEWLACADPLAMLSFLGSRISDRKLRLFACACCRRVWHLITSPPARVAVEASERYADGLASVQELRDIAHGRWAPLVCVEGASERQALHALQTAACASQVHREGILQAVRHSLLADKEMAKQAALLRDIVGNPFRCVGIDIDPDWLAWDGAVVRKLAQAIYDERTFDHLPVLADALEEAGASDTTILEHLRMPATHVRGCWVVDLLLAKDR
jgi:predicted component of type VI protein secretion system